MEDDGERADRLTCESDRIHPGEGPESFEPSGNVTQPARVQSAGTAVVPGVESGQQLADLFSATLTDHQPIGTHAQRFSNQPRQGDGACSLQVRLPGLKGDVMRVARAQLSALDRGLREM